MCMLSRDNLLVAGLSNGYVHVINVQVRTTLLCVCVCVCVRERETRREGFLLALKHFVHNFFIFLEEVCSG